MVALFRVDETDGVMLVTNRGQLIRTGLDAVAVKGRATKGVRIFRTGEDERIVSVERIPEVRARTGMRTSRVTAGTDDEVASVIDAPVAATADEDDDA